MNQSALEAIWRENRRWVAAVILAHKPSWEDLDDLLQEVAMTLVRKGHTIRERDSIHAWLRTVAINVARASARSGTRRRALIEPRTDVDLHPEATVSAAGDDDRMRTLEETDRTLQCLAELPETYREPLTMRAMHGMSSRAIGEILGIAEATVDTRVARARSMLRALLQRQSPSQARAIANSVDRRSINASSPVGGPTQNGAFGSCPGSATIGRVGERSELE